MMHSPLEMKMKDRIGPSCRTFARLYDLVVRLTMRSFDSSAARPVIPKRGEKDFEPKVSGGSGLQRHVLDRARNAMLDALKATRTASKYVTNFSRIYVQNADRCVVKL